MRGFTKILVLLCCASLLATSLYAQSTSKNHEKILVNTYMEDGAGPLNGKKRVIMDLFHFVGGTATKIGGWEEDQKDIVFTSGNAIIEIGKDVSLNSTILGGLTDPFIRFTIDGNEEIGSFNLTAAPFAIDMPSLREGTQDVVLKGVTVNTLGFIDNDKTPYVLKEKFTDGSLDVTLKDVTASRLVISPISDLSFVPIEHLKDEYKKVKTIYKDFDPETADDRGFIDNSWLVTATGGDGDGEGGGKSDLDVKKLVQEVFEDSFNKKDAGGQMDGFQLVSGKKDDGSIEKSNDDTPIIKFDINDPTFSLAGDITATGVQQTNLGNVALTTVYAKEVPLAKLPVITVAKGGTGATDAANARTNLSAQKQDGDLDDIAGLTAAENSFLVGSNANKWALKTFDDTLNLFKICDTCNLTVNKLTATDLDVGSDKNLKKDISSIENPLSIINRLKGHYFFFKQDTLRSFPTQKQIGFIAQELEEVLPDLVSNSFSIGENNFKSIRPLQIIPLLVEAIKEQQTQIEKQEKQIEALQKLVDELIKDKK